MARSASNKKAAPKAKVKAVTAKKKLPPPHASRASRAGSQRASSASGYVIGDRVSHPKFGDGVVTAIEVDKLTIKFANRRVKQILDYYVRRRQ